MAKIKSDPRNVRIHDKRNQQAIFESLKELGAGRSILIDNADSAVAGNGVLEQAQKLGIPIKVIESDGSELIAVKRTDLSPDDPKRKALAIADNRTGDLSIFDEAALAEQLVECGKLQLPTGFSADEIADLLGNASIFDDLVENNFTNSIKAMSDVFSVTFVFPKDTGAAVVDFIKQKGKPELTARLIEFCRKAVQ